MTERADAQLGFAQSGPQVMPVVGAAMVMFFLAALIEGFLSPSAAPYWVKICVALLSSGLLDRLFHRARLSAMTTPYPLDEMTATPGEGEHRVP